MSTICISSKILTGTVGFSSHRGFIACKGAPEMIKPFFKQPPSWYDQVYLGLASQGCRVLALGYRALVGEGDLKLALASSRAEIESGLEFVGFLVFHCPLKKDTKKVIEDLIYSGHQIVMITGDHPLTAIHVAKCIEILQKESLWVLLDIQNNNLVVTDGNTLSDCKKLLLTPSIESLKGLKLCLTGVAFEYLLQQDKEYFLNHLCANIVVAARFSPKNKETLLMLFKSAPLNWTTLMCGDGTNDVGALKQAHIGVALLDGDPEKAAEIMEAHKKAMLKKKIEQMKLAKQQWEARLGKSIPDTSTSNPLMSSLDDDSSNMIQFGDASIAAPFTSKLSTITSVASIIRQGRCTLVTTLQMYKILALNSLITAYSLSALSLAGVRHSDTQMTITGFLLAGCFLYLSRSQPLKQLSKQRPHESIFHPALITSILLQSLVHGLALYSIQQMAISFDPTYKPAPISVSDMFASDEDPSSGASTFIPTLLNSSIYLLSLMLQISTFVINYQGRPFRESLYENRGLKNALLIVAFVAWAAALELSPELNEYLQLTAFPAEYKIYLCGCMAGDFFLAYLVDKLCLLIFK